VATLIAMDIRLPKEREARMAQIQKLNEITSGTDVFICTDKKDAHYLGDFSNVAHVWLSNTSVREGVALHAKGKNTIQWHRLRECWGFVQSYEKSNGIEYSFIVKLRTDCGSKNQHNHAFKCWQYAANTELMNQAPDDTAFIYSDFQFGAGRKVFTRLASLYSRIRSDYWKRDLEYVNLDWGLVSKCDITAGQFTWLAYPKAAMGKPPCFLSECILQNKKLLEWSHNHSERDATHTAIVSKKNWRNPGVSSEKTLIIDLIRYGVSIQHFARFSADTRADTSEIFATGDCIDDSIDGDCLATMH